LGQGRTGDRLVASWTVSERLGLYVSSGSGAAAPQGALRAIDPSACPRSWRTFGPRRLRRQSQACPGRRSGWYGMTGPSVSWGSLEQHTVIDGRRSERHTGRPDRWRPRTNQAAPVRSSTAAAAAIRRSGLSPSSDPGTTGIGVDLTAMTLNSMMCLARSARRQRLRLGFSVPILGI
jgi:hypothetical protein